MRFPGLKQRVEPDVVGDDDGALSESWATVRDPRLGAWRITIIRRAVWSVMAAALPVSLFAVLLAQCAVSRSGTAQSEVAELWVRPPPVWAPAFDATAQIAATRFADRLDMEVAAHIDTAAQAVSVGFSADQFVGGANSATGGADARLDWASVSTFAGGERHSFLLANPDGTRFEAMSFMVSADGTVGWPHLVPAVLGDDADMGTVFGDGYETAAVLFGIADGRDSRDSSGGDDENGDSSADSAGNNPVSTAAIPSLCVGADTQRTVAAPAGLTERVEQYLEAYTSGDSDTLQEVARSGAETATYYRTGYRYRPLSLRLICYLPADNETGLPGTVQAWWVAEKTDNTGTAIPEMRDLRVQNTDGLWRVFDPVPQFGHAPLPVN